MPRFSFRLYVSFIRNYDKCKPFHLRDDFKRSGVTCFHPIVRVKITSILKVDQVQTLRAGCHKNIGIFYWTALSIEDVPNLPLDRFELNIQRGNSLADLIATGCAKRHIPRRST